jgi:YbgC/YbaW family acyl-CoA thioester hydrolase
MAEPLLSTRFHVCMADVDAAMILFYATPLRWAERVLSQWRREIGLPVSEMLRSGVGSPVVKTEVTYVRPMHMDEEVEAELWLANRSRRSYTLRCQFNAGPGGPVATQVWITQVAVSVGDDGQMHSTELPGDIAEVLDGAALNP